MRKSILFLCLVVVGCTNNDQPKMRVWKGTTPKISVSMMEKEVDPVLGTQKPDSFLTYLGNKDIDNLDDEMKGLLRTPGDPNQPWEGAAGAAKRAALIPMLKKAEAESSSESNSEAHVRRIAEAAPAAAHRVSAELLLARCLLEDGDSAAATDAAVKGLDWADKMSFDAKGVPLWKQLHPVRERALKVARAMAMNPKLAQADLYRLDEAVKKMNSNRQALAEAIARSFSNTYLVPAYQVASLRTGVNIFQAITGANVDHAVAESFASEVFKDHKSPYDPHEMAKLASSYTMGLIGALDKPWPVAKTAMKKMYAQSVEAWGFDPFNMTEAQFKDASLRAKTKTKIAGVTGPNSYLHVQALSRDYIGAIPDAYAFDLQDDAIVAGIQKAVDKAKNGGNSLSTSSGLVHDPVSGQPFVLSGSTVKSPYTVAPDDPQQIKDACGKSYSI